MITYDDITIVSDEISAIDHRIKCTPTVDFCGTTLSLPLIASPMHDVCNGEMARELRRLGTLGIIHKFQSIAEQVEQFKLAMPEHGVSGICDPTFAPGGVACAIGIVEDYVDRFKALYHAGCRIFCIDTANGANRQVARAIENIKYAGGRLVEPREGIDRFYIIAGNVATEAGYKFLAEHGVDAVRVGIAGGSVCETKTETGIYLPTLESVKRIAEYRKLWEPHAGKFPLIIADGGIRTPADMNKALVMGADLVMCGNVLAGTKEAPGEPFMENEVLYKLYRGSASFAVQKIANGEEPDYVEGREVKVKFKGPVEKVIKRFRNGLRSSMSYCNALNLSSYRQNACVETL